MTTIPTPGTELAADPAAPARRPAALRWALALLGVLSVGIGAVGVVTPGLPTTVFLLIASWCFARSCPWLEERLVRVPLFRPFIRFLEPGTVMPMRARLISLAAMWTAIGVSELVLFERHAPVWGLVLIPAAGLVGSWFIWRVARG